MHGRQASQGRLNGVYEKAVDDLKCHAQDEYPLGTNCTRKCLTSKTVARRAKQAPSLGLAFLARSSPAMGGMSRCALVGFAFYF